MPGHGRHAVSGGTSTVRPTAVDEPVFSTAGRCCPGVYDSVRRQLPEPVPVIAPADRNDDGFAYVQLHTYFWVEQRAGQWATVTATSSVPGLSLTVTAEPVRMVVDTGDGGRVECAGAPPALGPTASPVGFHGVRVRVPRQLGHGAERGDVPGERDRRVAGHVDGVQR